VAGTNSKLITPEYATERRRLSGPDGGQIDVSSLPDDEVGRRYAAIKANIKPEVREEVLAELRLAREI
jgi:hypothetical protein